jgi:hypothetical protein
MISTATMTLVFTPLPRLRSTNGCSGGTRGILAHPERRSTPRSLRSQIVSSGEHQRSWYQARRRREDLHYDSKTIRGFACSAIPALIVVVEVIAGGVQKKRATDFDPSPLSGPPDVDRTYAGAIRRIGGGTLTTAGNLVFQSINDGRLVAYSADKGEKLAEIQTGLRSGMGPPITYRVDGRQYVARWAASARRRPAATPDPAIHPRRSRRSC